MARPRHRWAGAVAVAAVVLIAGCSPDDTPAPGAARSPGTPPAMFDIPTPSPVEPGSSPTEAAGRTPQAAATTPGSAPSIPSGPRLTPSAFGPLRLGMSEAAAADTGFIGPIGVGCEPAGTRGAELQSPGPGSGAQGQVTFQRGSLAAVAVTGGAATAEGVAVGHTLERVREVYAGATVSVDRGTEETFGVWLVDVTRGDGGTYGMLVDPETGQVTRISVPRVRFCE